MKKIFTLLLIAFFATLSAKSTKLNNVNIVACPTASINYAGSPFCASNCIGTVTLTGTDAYTGGIFTSTPGLAINSVTGAINPCVSAPGTYVVTYTISAGGGCPAVATTTTVTIAVQPTAAISYPGTPFCQNSPTQFVTITGTDNFMGGTYYSTAGLTLNPSTGAITPNTTIPGTYTVTYAIPAGGGCFIFNATTIVTILPTAMPTFSAIAPICSGGALMPLPSTSNEGITGVWSPVLNNTNTMTYTFTPSAGQCANNAMLTIIVNPSPTISGSSSACVGATTQLTGSGTPAASNPWTSSNTAIATVSSTGLVSAVSPGTTTITYKNNNGCTTTQSIIVNAPTTVTVNSPSICTGETATIITTAGAPGTYSYVWTVPAGFPNPGNVHSFTTTVAGTYSVVITNVATGCSSTSSSGTVTILPAGTPLTLFCANQTPTSVDFDWNNIVGITNYNYSYSIDGGPSINGSQAVPTSLTINALPNQSILFTLEPIGSVCVTPQTITCGTLMSTNENNMINLVYNPNPVNDILNIRNDQIINKVTAFNQLGQIVIQKEYNNNEVQLDFSGLKTGIYFIAVDSDSKQSTFKIVKK
jgi:type IX secretion system substrate protein/Big-like domain-containing protein